MSFLDCQLSKYTFEGHLDYVFKSEEVEYFSKKNNIVTLKI